MIKVLIGFGIFVNLFILVSMILRFKKWRKPFIFAILFVLFMFWWMEDSVDQYYKDTAITIPKITKLSSEVSKLCLYRNFHSHNININITPKLKETYSDANCTLDTKNQSCTCTIHGHTYNHEVYVTTICTYNKNITNCSTKIKLSLQ